jgi:predicted MFS family arabinose efflux permease
VGFVEISIAVGLLVGPVVGSVLYSLLGYKNTFLVFGGILLLASIPLITLIPSDLNNKKEEEASQMPSEIEKKITYSMFLKDFKSASILFGATILMIPTYFSDSILSVHLEEDFGIETDKIGYVYVIPFFLYLITLPIVTWICLKIERKLCIVLSFVVVTIALFVAGPSEVLQLPEYI